MCKRGPVRDQGLVHPFHLTEEKTEAQMTEAACPGSQGNKMEEVPSFLENKIQVRWKRDSIEETSLQRQDCVCSAGTYVAVQTGAPRHFPNKNVQVIVQNF